MTALPGIRLVWWFSTEIAIGTGIYFWFMNCTSVSLLILLLWRGSSWVNLFISCDGEGELSIASPVRVYIIKMVRVRVMVRVMARVTHCFLCPWKFPVLPT